MVKVFGKQIGADLILATGLVFAIFGLLLGGGALMILGPIVLGAIDNVAADGSIPVSDAFNQARNNSSNVLSGLMGTDLPAALRLALTLLSIGIIVIVFGFVFGVLEKRKGKKGGMGSANF